MINYTDEETEVLKKEYTENPCDETIASLAETLGKSNRSIISKLSKMGIYKAKTYLSKNGERPVKKEELVAKLAQALNEEVESLPGLEKVNKVTLIKLLKAVSKKE
jgi:hypothetical protein